MLVAPAIDAECGYPSDAELGNDSKAELGYPSDAEVGYPSDAELGYASDGEIGYAADAEHGYTSHAEDVGYFSDVEASAAHDIENCSSADTIAIAPDIIAVENCSSADTIAIAPDMIAGWRYSLCAALPDWPLASKPLIRDIFAMLSQECPDSFRNDCSGKALNYIFNQRLFVDRSPVCASRRPLRSSTWKAEAQAAGLLVSDTSDRIYRFRYLEVAELIFTGSRLFWASLADRVSIAIRQGLWRGILLLFVGQADEASAKLRVRYDRNVDATQDNKAAAETAKVVQSELRVGIVVQERASGQFRFITGLLPCNLAVVDRGTAESLHALYEQIYEGLPGFGPSFQKEFDHVCFAYTRDKCSANEKQTKAARRNDAKFETPKLRLTLGCTIHRVATIATKTYSLADDHISGCLAFAIAQRGPGRFTSLLRFLGDVLVQKLRIVRGQDFRSSDPQAFEHREALVNLLLPRGNLTTQSGSWRSRSMSRHLVRSRYDRYFNGNIQDSDFVWHFAAPGGLNDEALKVEFCREAPSILLPRLLDHFPRHRWTGAHEVVCEVALFSATHNLLAESVSIWCSTLGTEVHPKPQATEVDQPAILPIDDGYSSDELQERDGLLAMNSTGVAGQPQDWHEMNNKAKVDVKAWVASNPTSTMLVLAVALGPLATLRDHYLLASGVKWEDKNNRDTVEGKPHKFRILEAHNNVQENEFATGSLDLLTNPSLWTPLPGHAHTVAARSFAFRVLFRQLAGVYMLLAVPHQCMPYALFKLLEDRSFARAFIEMPRCLHEEFSDAFISGCRGSAEQLASHASLCVLSAIADTVRLDTARVETGHSFWQREARARGLQTMADSLIAVSATFVMHRARAAEAACKKTPGKTAKRGRRRKERVAKKITKKRRPWQPRGTKRYRLGGGGAFRQFLHKKKPN